MSELMSVSDAARALEEELGVPIAPRIISDLFYQRKLRDEACPLIGGRRLIPESYLPAIATALRRLGLLSSAIAAANQKPTQLTERQSDGD